MLNPPDDDRILQKSISTAKDFGTICLKIFRVEDIHEDSDTEQILFKLPKLENQPVHERPKKAGTYRVTCVICCGCLLCPDGPFLRCRLGEIEPTENETALNVTYVDSLDTPHYTFAWRYRPKGLAQPLMNQTDTLIILCFSYIAGTRDRTSRSSSFLLKQTKQTYGIHNASRQLLQTSALRSRRLRRGSSSQVKLEDREVARALQVRPRFSF